MIDDFDWELDEPAPPTVQPSRPLSSRDMEIHTKLSTGKTYAEVGEDYGVSRQRIKQIANKLANAGLAVSPLIVRQASKLAEQHDKRTQRYGANYDAIASNPNLRRYLSARLTSKRNNALAKGIPFDLTISDLYPLPEVCPILGIALSYGGGQGAADDCMALDRIDPTKGYTKNNVLMVSQRANRIKNNATPAELRKIAGFYAKYDTTT